MPFSDLQSLSPRPASSPQPSIYPKKMVRLPSPLPPSRTTSFTSEPQEALKPYLSLKARLSHTILSLPLLSLLLALASFLSANNSAQARAEDAKAQIMATCKGVEQGVRFITDGGMARVMADKINEQTVDGVKATLRGVHKVLEMSLTIIEKVIGFMIDMYRSLLMCTIEFVVRGSLAIMIGVVETITDGITTTLNGIRSKIQADINSANAVIATAIKAINSVTSVVNVNLSVPQFDIPSLNGLANVSIPTTFEDDLRRLNSSLPTLQEFKDILEDFIAVPFDKLKGEMNESFTEMMGKITVESLPTIGDAPNSTSTSLVGRAETEAYDLCGQMDTSFLDDIASSLSRLAKVATGLLVLAFLLLWFALISWEWYTWKQMNEQAQEVEDLLKREMAEGRRVDGLRMVQMVEHPVIEKYGGKVVGLLTRKNETNSNLRWFLAYITHPPALLLLGFGILTFLTMQIQLSAVHAIRERSSAEANSAIAEQSQSLGVAINQAMLQQSGDYATDMNLVIQGWQEDIDTTIFGPWLNATTVTLNTTLIEFYDKVEQVLNVTFGNTILATSVNNFAYCILGSKIDNMATALTWIKDNAKVTLPTFDANILMLSTATMSSVADPIAKAAAGSGSSDGDSDDQGVIGKLFDRYEDELRKQRNIAAIFIGLYGIVMLVGLAVFTWHSWFKRPFARWRMQRRGLGKQHEKPVHTAYRPTEAEKAVHLGPVVTSTPDHQLYPGQGYNNSQQSFFDDSDQRGAYQSSSPSHRHERFGQGMAARMRALSPIHRSPIQDDYDEPMLPPSAAPPEAQPSASWQDRLGNLLALPTFASKLSRKTSQKSSKTDVSWSGTGSSPGPSRMFQISGLSALGGYGSQQAPPVIHKPVPSPLHQNPFSLGDEDEVGTPIAARFAQHRTQASSDQNPFAGRYV